MKQPRRLLSEGATDFERQLLRSVARERPSALHRARMLQGMGLAGPALWAATAQAMAATAGGKVAIGVTAAAIIAGGVLPVARQALVERSSVAEPARVEAAVVEGAVRPAEPVSEPEPAAAKPPEPAVLPDPERLEAVTESAALTSALREQIELLDAARGSLSQHERSRALRLLARYDEQFPRGALKREAGLLRRAAQKREPSPHTH